MFKKQEKEIASLAKSLPEGSILAGGALTSVFMDTCINDLDLYFKGESSLVNAITSAYECQQWCVALSERAITFSANSALDVSEQFVYFDYFDNPEDIFDRFDFTCCMAAYDKSKPKGQRLVMHEDFATSIMEKKLRFNPNTSYPIISLLRVFRYMEKGFTIDRNELLKIAFACAKQGISSWGDVKYQIGGYYGHKIDLAIDESEPFDFDSLFDIFDSKTMIEPNKKTMPYNPIDAISKLGINLTREEMDKVESYQPI